MIRRGSFHLTRKWQYAAVVGIEIAKSLMYVSLEVRWFSKGQSGMSSDCP
jgi:hypothetical protein